MKRILVVCMGNICRSPTGEAVLRARAKMLGVEVDIDSAGTIGYHAGSRPDSRAMAAGKQRGYSFKGMRARQVRLTDFEEFDLILAADKANLSDLLDLCPSHLSGKVSLFLSHSDSDYDEIPDPYYGGEDGFERVLDLIEEASDNILKSL
ncbi:low molecular weight protein-tyrosine-phosphatase [Vibrio sp. CAU 1672]|uniref:low molecular weight protein-tyrosine-phosphatase n=1 Tax=Vibrio sp. CAU 1672 TaxID=3032594 RepID=UPI0023DA19AB|nr:low molecular weight protein-tyrosine-phosphatase [Vibrio sp. CAU 1672]MDF2155968.1 low molecular weight phosphotyrosine protein phosphatase [Vibrio sp. CAU 1672]